MLIFSSTAVYVRGVAQNLPAENRSNGAAAAMRRCIVAKNVRRRHGERTGCLCCSCDHEAGGRWMHQVAGYSLSVLLHSMLRRSVSVDANLQRGRVAVFRLGR